MDQTVRVHEVVTLPVQVYIKLLFLLFKGTRQALGNDVADVECVNELGNTKMRIYQMHCPDILFQYTIHRNLALQVLQNIKYREQLDIEWVKNYKLFDV